MDCFDPSQIKPELAGSSPQKMPFLVEKGRGGFSGDMRTCQAWSAGRAPTRGQVGLAMDRLHFRNWATSFRSLRTSAFSPPEAGPQGVFLFSAPHLPSAGGTKTRKEAELTPTCSRHAPRCLPENITQARALKSGESASCHMENTNLCSSVSSGPRVILRPNSHPGLPPSSVLTPSQKERRQ